MVPSEVTFSEHYNGFVCQCVWSEGGGGGVAWWSDMVSSKLCLFSAQFDVDSLSMFWAWKVKPFLFF